MLNQRLFTKFKLKLLKHYSKVMAVKNAKNVFEIIIIICQIEVFKKIEKQVHLWCGFCWYCHSTGHTQWMGKRGGILLLCFSIIWVTQEWGRQIVQVQGGLYSRMSFIFMYETSTLTPFVKPCDILNLAVQNIFYINCMWNPLLRTIWGQPFWL